MNRKPETGNRKPYFSVLGCKVNYADTRALLGQVSGMAAGPTALVGTCCVTSEGEKQSRKEVRRAARLVGPEGTVFVTGCAVRYAPEKFSDLADNVAVLELEPDGARVPAPLEGGRTRSFLKVQDGCANLCAYCVIPLVRGRPRSVPAAQVMAEAGSLLSTGYGELVVSGINLGAYSDGDVSLPTLLERLSGIDGLARLRISSIEVVHIDDGLLEVMAGQRVIGGHLHVPLQSGDDRVLDLMGRRYDKDLFAGRIERARAALPGLNLTTDVIVGLPGEDEEAFANTLAFVERCGFSKVHVFSYSARPGTRAAEREGAAPAVKKERSRRLRGLSDRLGRDHRERKRGQVGEILLESAVEPGVYAGYSDDYTRYLVPSGREGQLVSVVGERVSGDCLWGKVIDHE